MNEKFIILAGGCLQLEPDARSYIIHCGQSYVKSKSLMSVLASRHDISMLDFIYDNFHILESHTLRINCIVCGEDDFNLIRTCDAFDVQTHRQLLKAGIVGSLFGATVFLKVKYEDAIYFFAENSPDLGRFFPEIAHLCGG